MAARVGVARRRRPIGGAAAPTTAPSPPHLASRSKRALGMGGDGRRPGRAGPREKHLARAVRETPREGRETESARAARARLLSVSFSFFSLRTQARAHPHPSHPHPHPHTQPSASFHLASLKTKNKDKNAAHRPGSVGRGGRHLCRRPGVRLPHPPPRRRHQGRGQEGVGREFCEGACVYVWRERERGASAAPLCPSPLSHLPPLCLPPPLFPSLSPSPPPLASSRPS